MFDNKVVRSDVHEQESWKATIIEHNMEYFSVVKHKLRNTKFTIILYGNYAKEM